MNDLSTPFDVIRVLNLPDVSLKLVRIERLKLLRKERGEPGPVEFGLLIGKKPNQVSDLLSGRASFGEKVARSIEEKVGKPARWMDKPIGAPAMTGDDAVWPLAEILTPEEWMRLPPPVKKNRDRWGCLCFGPASAEASLGKIIPFPARLRPKCGVNGPARIYQFSSSIAIRGIH